MASWVLVLALAAGGEAAEKRLNVRAGVLTGAGCAIATGGAVALGIGLYRHDDRATVGGSALIGLGLTAIALAIAAWLLPKEPAVLSFLQPSPRGVGVEAWLQLP